MNLRKKDRQYWEATGAKRAEKQWKKSERVENDLKRVNKATSDSVLEALSFFLLKYSDSEGNVDYTELERPLNISELREYRSRLLRIQPLVDKWEEEEFSSYFSMLLGLKNLTRLHTLINEIDIHLSDLARQENKIITDFLVDTYQDNYYKNHFDSQKGTGMGYLVETVAILEAFKVISEPFAGEVYANSLKIAKKNNLNHIRRAIIMNAKNSRVTHFFIKDIKGRLDSGFRQALSVLRNETASAVEKANLQAMRDNPYAEKYILIATLDKRTSEICQRMDNKVYPVKKARIGVNFPPFHYNCRTTTGVYYDDVDYEELERKARDPKTNQNYFVPANTSYTQWFKEYVN